MKETTLNILFVCSRNRWRSPTAEQVFKNTPGISVRSAGTSASARKRISIQDIRWASLILVMEHKHKSRLVEEFADALAGKAIHILDIPDDFEFMDPELVDQLQHAVEPILDAL